MGWIGVDLDGTLAHYTDWKGIYHIGEPVPAMLERVKNWISKGQEVRIFTARMCDHGKNGIDVAGPIEAWCLKHLGKKLKVTNVKDYAMIELWDDRAIQVIFNTGMPVE